MNNNSGAAIGITVAGQSGVAGQWAYLLNTPTYVLYDQYGYIYIMDTGNTRIQRWIPGATYGTTVVASSTMINPRGMRFDPFGNLVVADFSQHRIISFRMLCRKNFIRFIELKLFILLFFKFQMQQQQH